MLGRTGKQFLRHYIIFFMCLVVLFVPLYRINLSMVSQSYLDATGALLETGLSNLESDLGHIEALARSAYDSPKFRRLSYMKGDLDISDYYYTIPLVDDFKRYFAAAGMVIDCGIIYDSGIVLTNKRIYFSGSEFYSRYFMETGIPSYSQWLAAILQGYSINNLIPLREFTTMEGPYEAITYAINFSYPSQKGGVFFATLEKKYILSRLATDEVLQNGRVVIYDPAGNVLLDSSPADSLNADDTIAVGMTGAKRGVRVTVDIPRTVFRSKLIPFQRIALVFTLTYIIIGVILSVLFAQRSAKPIREIVEEVLGFGGSQSPEGSPAEFKNDYKYIQHFLSKAGRDYEVFEAKLARQEEFQRDNLFERLLHGLVYSTAAYQSAKDYFPDLPDAFRIAAIWLPDMEEAALTTHAMRQTMIKDIIEPYMPRSAYTHFSGNTIVLLLPDEAAEKPLDLLRSLIADLQGKLNTTCKAALSERVRDIRDIHQAFYLVSHMLRLPRNNTGDDIIQKENMGVSSFPIEFLDASRLYELLLHGEEEKAVDFINNMFYEFCERGYADENDIQQLFFLYRRILLQILNDLQLDIQKDEAIPAYDSRLDVSFLFARMAGAARKICGIIKTRHAGEDKGFEQSIIKCIDDNIINPGLYTRMITANFHISENRLQNIVRKWTGKSFLEYVESKRMELSRDMLLKTSLSVSQISKDCGYSSDNSFYKAFRRYYKMSPSEIRK
ncbi:hypothetical protein AGMMS50255_1720 [Spirochaetia bacterium]|nr:hypothetical protein AGMMS50255_1720 [Spirochaetia bacterium]